MHEAGLMQTALDIATEHVRRHGAQRIHRLTLRVGRMAGVEPEALTFAFAALSAGTAAAGAELAIETVPTICRCAECDREFEPPDFIYRCPTCGTLSTVLSGGQELELASLEVS